MRLIHKNEKGMVLPLGLMFLAIIAIMGTTAVIVTTTDLKIGSNYMAGEQAFYDAEAGVQYAIAMIENGLGDDTLALSGSSVTVKYTAPPGFSFDTITTLTQVGTTSNYSFQVIGHSGNANSAIEVVFARDSLFQYGAFGDEKLDLEKEGKIYSYDSGDLTNQPGNDDFESTGEGDVGSNGKVKLKKDTFIDGDVGLGDDGKDPCKEATCDDKEEAIVIGDIEDVPRVDPDPLGAKGGDLADDFKAYKTANDNTNTTYANPVIEDMKIDTSSTITLTGKEGGANFYLESITLKKGATLVINADAGPVNIYLTGKLDAQSESVIDVDKPADLTIFSNSTKKIDFKHGSTFKGTIYAPYADVDVKHNADIYGMIWAKKVDIKNGYDVYLDTALKEKDEWLADTVKIGSWREVLN